VTYIAFQQGTHVEVLSVLALHVNVNVCMCMCIWRVQMQKPLNAIWNVLL